MQSTCRKEIAQFARQAFIRAKRNLKAKFCLQHFPFHGEIAVTTEAGKGKYPPTELDKIPSTSRDVILAFLRGENWTMSKFKKIRISSGDFLGKILSLPQKIFSRKIKGAKPPAPKWRPWAQKQQNTCCIALVGPCLRNKLFIKQIIVKLLTS